MKLKSTARQKFSKNQTKVIKMLSNGPTYKQKYNSYKR